LNKQRTITRAVKTAGIGLHSGERVQMTLHPAAADTGIVFRRVDLKPPIEIPVNALTVGDTQLCTCIERDGAKVATIEHLMSA